MAVPAAQREVAVFLRGLSGVEPIETHISLVYRGADTVWKLKKSVRLPFLDFSTPAARHFFVARELELNAPAAPGLYRDVVSVVRRPDGSLALDGNPPPDALVLDWVLRMARVPENDFLDRIAAAGGLTPALLDALGDAVALYHQNLKPVLGTAPAASMRAVLRGNETAALTAGLPETRVRAWRARAEAELDALAPWLEARAKDGFVRRAHGDLHLGNLCLWQGRVVPFDALEFDEAMATIDLGYDFSFLLMDLDRRTGRAAANRVMNRYVARTGDAAFTRGLPLFLSLRAMIRAHVAARSGETAASASYLDAAEECLRPAQAIVVAVGGLPGSGKSTLARALAPTLGRAPGALVLRSDEFRKRLYGVSPEERLPPEAYLEPISKKVFFQLADAVWEAASGGQAAVADATFLDAAHREEVTQAAAAARAKFCGIWLQAPLPELEARIAARVGDASDATVSVLRAAAARDPGAGTWWAVDATDETAALVHAREAVRATLLAC
jgi:uncharacterized protein